MFCAPPLVFILNQCIGFSHSPPNVTLLCHFGKRPNQVTAWHCQYPLTVMWIALELIEPTHSWSPEVVYHMFGLRVVLENYPM